MKDGHAPEHRTGLPAKGALVCTWILCWVLGEAPPSLREDAVDGADGVEGQRAGCWWTQPLPSSEGGPQSVCGLPPSPQ